MKIDEHFSNAAISSVHSPPKPNEEKGFNADDYKEDFGVSEFSKDEIEILKSLWSIMTIFVDIGWGVDRVQHLLPELFETVDASRASLPANPACDNKDDETRTNEQQKGGADE
jgi:hypothetical protein